MALDGVVGRTRVAPCGVCGEFLQLAIFLADGRVLDERLFRLTAFSGQEGVSTPFEFQLQLRANSEAGGEPLGFADIVGRPVTFAVRRPRAEPEPQPQLQGFEALRADGGRERFSIFNGIASGFSMAEPGVYTLAVKAALWKLNLANAYAIHSQLNVRDAIARLLDRHGIVHDMSAIEGNENPAVARVQDWMQAGESDYAFLQRLMSKAHLYYYFVHGPDSHTVVFANRPNYREVYADGRRLRYTHTSAEELGLTEDDVITQYSYEQTLTSSAVSGLFTRQENAWEEDPVAHFTSYQETRSDTVGALPFHQYKIYQYGCDEQEVARFTDATASTLASSGTQLSGGSRCARFRTGYRFGVAGPVGPESRPNPVRPSLEGRRFVLTQVQHEATLDGGYRNSFQATEESGLITPFSLQDTHQGSMLARVVACHDDGAHSRRWEYAYKTDFEPAQQTFEDHATGGTLNAKGVYVEFSTAQGPSAPVFVKLAPHMQTVPEIGVTVLVSRANDESELPEIQSIVQSNGSKVVMPSGWTANTQVGSSFSTAYGDSKSVRFGRCSDVGPADVDAAVQQIEEAYKSGDYKDVSYSRGGGYSFSTSEAGRNGLLSRSESHGNTYSTQQAAEAKSWSDVGYSYSESAVDNTESRSTVRENSRSYQTVNGLSYSESKIGDSNSITTIARRSDSETTIGGASVSRTTITGKSDSYQTMVGGSYSEMTVHNGSESDSTVYGSSINRSTVHGESKSESTVHGDSRTESTVHGLSRAESTVDGDSVNISTVKGASRNDSKMLAQASATLIGFSVSTAETGVSLNQSASGDATDINVGITHKRYSALGFSTEVNLVGKSLSISLTGSGVQVKGGNVEEVELKNFKLTLPQALMMVL